MCCEQTDGSSKRDAKDMERHGAITVEENYLPAVIAFGDLRQCDSYLTSERLA